MILYWTVWLITTLCIFDSETGGNVFAFHLSGKLVSAIVEIQTLRGQILAFKLREGQTRRSWLYANCNLQQLQPPPHTGLQFEPFARIFRILRATNSRDARRKLLERHRVADRLGGDSFGT